MVFVRSGGVRGHGMDHTMRFPRTLARFGLTWHGGSRFSCFGKYWKLTSSPNTSKLVLGTPDWSSDFFESQGTISGAIKPINVPTNDPQKENCPGNWTNSPNHHLLIKWLSFLGLFLGPMGPGTTWDNPWISIDYPWISIPSPLIPMISMDSLPS